MQLTFHAGLRHSMGAKDYNCFEESAVDRAQKPRNVACSGVLLDVEGNDHVAKVTPQLNESTTWAVRGAEN